jgi:hypothetical protein
VFCNMPPLIVCPEKNIRVPEFSTVAYEPALTRYPCAQG